MIVYLFVMAIGGNTLIPMDTMSLCQKAAIEVMAANPTVKAICLVRG